ncbi:hypothetical protein SS21_22535 [Enterobacter roggenkampii]|nr:hypothetical protein PI91_15655 [Enterobacter sp. FB]KJM84552.1 hypothetical protein SS21_22535 [Enterobacter roggenkampii]OFU68754.1 hypothetical protein HMPREF3143_11850 [Enterobacter sp. HMSC16D10]OIR50081.1 hypothetical protein BH716_15850 [Lelliottia nimipressuralis]PWI80196.1 hypothetical protein DEO48_10060 [Enterobacter sp. CGMCC 5087]SEO35046.1 hypothetical protein SAMN03159286_0403 [Enterobacter sp. NFIX58]
MFERASKYVIVYLMLIVSFMLFFSTLGYYIFVFDWSVTILEITINAALLIILLVASIAIYYFAEKLKSRL